MTIPLRDYQAETITQARAAIRAGARNVLICAPTGAGKTQIAAHLIEECRNKGNRANFVVDRLSLLNQTSEVFDGHKIDHGVVQSKHLRFSPSKPIQVCSIQTVARRHWPESALDVIDEAHILHEVVKTRIGPRVRITLGLTATPFTKGLAKHFDAIINVTTTNRLIEQGWLCPYRIFSCAEPNMEGVKVTSLGEWDTGETEQRALEVVGDVVVEYMKHGQGRKFICSAVDTAHVEALKQQFLALGINVASYTYKDDDDDRADTVEEFRKEDSVVRGLITVTAASRGFDVPSVSCIIMARPLRKSLAEHIQLFGRGLRPSPGKEDCLVLDHSGNMVRFWSDMNGFFEEGVSKLDDGKTKEKKKPADEDAEARKCPKCGHLHKPAPFCPACGHQYPPKAAVVHAPGTLKELVSNGDPGLLRAKLWPQVCGFVKALNLDPERSQRRAQALYHDLTGQFARARFDTTNPTAPSIEVLNKIHYFKIKWNKSRKSGAPRATP